MPGPARGSRAALLPLLLTGAAPREPDLPSLLAAIRHATGVDRAAVEPATELVDRAADGTERHLLVGWRSGAYRIGDESGFDGHVRWQADDRRGEAIPASLRQFEKAAWPVWLRDHWWLRRGSGVAVALAPSTEPGTIALTLRRPGGVVPATVFVDRATMLPARLVVPYERGPFEARYGDWRRYGGVAVAGTVVTSYRGEGRTTLARIAPAVATRLAAPPPPADARFDPALPARLDVRRGPAFADGARGHVFVRASISGVEGWWLLDSGADGMLIDKALADRLGLPVLGESRSTGADGRAVPATLRRGGPFRVGRLSVPALPFRATDLSGSTAPPGERRAGVIGHDVFARAAIEMARDGDEVTLCDPAAYRRPAGARWHTLDWIDQTPAVPGSVERHPGLFQVDTGAAGGVDLYQPFVAAHRLLDGRVTAEVTSAGSGGAFTMRAGRIAAIEIAGRRFADVAAGFRTRAGRDGAGVIGRALLRPFRTVFDEPHRRIAFAPAASRPGCR